MVPLKLSLEMIFRGSYEVNLANMDRVIILSFIFHYALLHAVARCPSSVDTHTCSLEVIATIN